MRLADGPNIVNENQPLMMQQWTNGPINREIVPFSAEMDHPDKVTYI
jgi:hypothetical protein